jgi:peptidoglycan/xylan/chitin deacetylase (PgdA/CDA1 family)
VIVAAVLLAGLALGAPVTGWAPPALAVEGTEVEPATDGVVLEPLVVWRGPRDRRVVALTFDDGWSPKTLRGIYRILVRENVPATFFVTGMYVGRDPDLWRKIAARFPLANHSHRHRDTRRLTDRQVLADLARAREVVEEVTDRPMVPYFRPPYGYRDSRTDRLAAEAGFPTIVMWNTSATDAESRPTVASVVRSASTGRAGSIVLLHAGPKVTVRALPAIIARYRARGFGFVTVPELLGVQAGQEGARPGAAGLPRPAGLTRDYDRPGVAPEPPEGSPPGPAAVPPAPEPAIAAPPEAPPGLARDSAWARSSGTPAVVAAWSVAVLLAMIAGGAIVGRRARRKGEPGG